MGGRGSSSASSKMPGGIQTKLEEFKNRGAMVVGDWSSMDNRATEAVLTGVLDILDEFPQAEMRVIQADWGFYLSSNAYAGASRFNMALYIQKARFSGDSTQALSDYEHDVADGFHPTGTTVADIGAHEVGHLLEQAILNKYVSEISMANERAMKNRTVAKNIIRKAAAAAKKTTEGKGKKISELVKSVSGYAGYNRSEALAECVADYHANRENANVLSREVWKILKQELG